MPNLTTKSPITPALSTIIYGVNDPSGTPADGKITLTALKTLLLNGIEAGADVTDTANVTAAGALMDSEVTNLAAVKAFDPTDYATAAQGALADSAQQPPTEGAFVDGDKTKLDGIAANATANSTDAVLLARANHTGTQAIATVSGLQAALDALQPILSEGAFVDGDKTKLDNIEANADVTDEANVVSSLDGATLTDIGTPVTGDFLLIQDASASGALKKVNYSVFASLGGGDAWGDAVDADIVPDGDGTRDLGSSANRFAELHVDTIDIGGTDLPAPSTIGAELLVATNESTARGSILAGSPMVLDWQSGRYYTSRTGTNIETTAGSLGTIDSGTIFYMPMYVPNDVTIDQMAWQIVTAVASSNCRAAIYEDVGGTWVGGDRLVETGDVSAATTGVKTVTVDVDLTEGWYWRALHVGGDDTMKVAFEVDYASAAAYGHTTAGTIGLEVPVGTQTYGTLPTTGGSATYTNLGTSQPYLAVRVA